MERRMNEAHRDTAKNALLHELALAAREANRKKLSEE